jgi:formylglycine-generating enzyme required for sulfatase activity
LGGSDRVIRGGSWANYADNCRLADRYIVNPYSPIHNIGFRTVLPRAP